ncbi:C40 family peptidase [Christiangramia flava]|uniref:Putative lipoprotein nlpC n=1 Tax=Christiangramia flava JLT2011 TaxID=1229726 RepID=A0A1L7I296_9FLAO|nr:C40 family peptidase [Christiangramia flava]APU67726.1 putative lipoprotein nlpC [Christiangramia flava JLT2011]OSS40230.1 lipoprotein nlpC [Christiangramia flava JLT2011]
MRGKILLLLLTIALSSCGAKHHVVTTKKESSRDNPAPINDYKVDENAEPASKVAFKVIKNAKKFEGVKYRYGGTDKKGMDCSGLIYVSFQEEGLSLPRTSRAMSLQGKRLFLREVAEGDLLFFETNKNKKVINHVGLVINVENNDIYFIHSTTSAGVIISSLSEPYWNQNFVMARRVM